MREFKQRKPDTDSGRLRTPVTFLECGPRDGPEPGEIRKKILYSCFAEVYNPSMKDLSIMDTTGTREGATIKIRDAGTEYIPSNKHSVVLDDYRYRNKVFSVVDVRPDLTDNRFVVILLGVES